MRAEAWVTIEFPKPKYDYMKVKPKITKVHQKRPSEGLYVKIVLEMDDVEWEPTVMLKLHPLEVSGTVDKSEFRASAQAWAESYLKANE